jgi:hypothetical protein
MRSDTGELMRDLMVRFGTSGEVSKPASEDGRAAA